MRGTVAPLFEVGKRIGHIRPLQRGLVCPAAEGEVEELGEVHG
jgi:hypothetical protein